MGWTYMHRDPGGAALDFWRREMGDGVLDCATVGFSETYLAYRIKTGAVIGVALMTHWRHGDFFNFGYKDMSEDMGPGICRCPARILDQLSTLEETGLTPSADGDGAYELAADWRNRCRENLARRAARPHLREGLWLRFPETLTFSNGVAADTFAVVDPKRRLFRPVVNSAVHGPLVCIRRTTLENAAVIP